ncbi:hypothetical protein Phum_PHUM516380 [Pediculus humanus corporis]|uniref:Kazal-like domain-containing protein n=1 Tax=Pediculus humanus subsp. corporis TaxID=121224 RepID=E0VYP8_PEDHC|nr:uncharacterized protein Phum_PHUM516380 [Pediculus humanus corporis]EEB18504.1 hypothetical protein Phum_PHUM516380 [Pediculus humanus corporis]
MCPVTPEFNPVCGSDYSTYSNMGRLKCAQYCGKSVTLFHYGRCRGMRAVTADTKTTTTKKPNPAPIKFLNFSF